MSRSPGRALSCSGPKRKATRNTPAVRSSVPAGHHDTEIRMRIGDIGVDGDQALELPRGLSEDCFE